MNRGHLRGALACAWLLLWTAGVSAQAVSVPSLKAAFLVNFAKFAVWPDEALPAGRVFLFCVVGDRAVAEALKQAITERPGQTPVSAEFVSPAGVMSGCHLLYLGGIDLRQSRRMLDALGSAPVFTVSDVDGFAEMGGVSQLRLEKGQMRFAINPAAALRAHLALSAKLLSLATLVKDGRP